MNTSPSIITSRLPETENGLYYVERAKGGSVLNYCAESNRSVMHDTTAAAHPHTFMLLYNESDKSAHLSSFSKDKETPDLKIYRDISSFDEACKLVKNDDNSIINE